MLQLIPPIQHHVHTDPTQPPPDPAPGWQHRLWDTTTIPELVDTDQTLADLYLHYLNQGDHTAIRYLIRIAALTKVGGLYTEPDTYPAEGLKTAPYMDDDAWLVLHPAQQGEPDDPLRITGQIMATRPNHPYLASLRRAVLRIAQDHAPTADELGDNLLTEVYARKKRKDIPLIELSTVTAPAPAPEPTPRLAAPTHPEPEKEPEVEAETPAAYQPPEPPKPPRWNLNPPAPRGPAYTRTPPETPWW